jgi:hypothetical protein
VTGEKVTWQRARPSRAELAPRAARAEGRAAPRARCRGGRLYRVELPDVASRRAARLIARTVL